MQEISITLLHRACNHLIGGIGVRIFGPYNWIRNRPWNQADTARSRNQLLNDFMRRSSLGPQL